MKSIQTLAGLLKRNASEEDPLHGQLTIPEIDGLTEAIRLLSLDIGIPPGQYSGGGHGQRTDT